MRVLAPLQTSAMSGVLVRLMPQLWPVTVAEAVALTVPVAEVPEAGARLVVVRLMARVLVRVALAPGSSGPQAPTVRSSPGLVGVPLSSTSVPEAEKKSPALVTR